MSDPNYYFNILYPLQDKALRVFTEIDTGFYLSGGTAASRGYLQHRFSDDLDLFVNDDDRFGLWGERIINRLLAHSGWTTQVVLKENRFIRLQIVQDDTLLKIEMINDVPARVGQVEKHPILGMLDSAENILANKVTALLDREEPKDIADIWGFCNQKGLSLKNAINHAESKAAGIFPADLARLLCSVTRDDWQSIRWISAPPVEQFVAQVIGLGEGLLLL